MTKLMTIYTARSLSTLARLLAIILFVILMPITTIAAPLIITAQDAFEKQMSGGFIVLDIRSSEEWKESGVAKGAWPVSMHEADFSQRLHAILSNNDSNRIALICATGGRTAYISRLLEKNGVSGVFDISEGMFGNGSAPGWIARSLPIIPLEEAMENYTVASQSWK